MFPTPEQLKKEVKVILNRKQRIIIDEAFDLYIDFFNGNTEKLNHLIIKKYPN